MCCLLNLLLLICRTTTCFYIQEGIYDRFVHAIADRSSKLKVTDGLAEGAEMGPMADAGIEEVQIMPFGPDPVALVERLAANVVPAVAEF